MIFQYEGGIIMKVQLPEYDYKFEDDSAEIKDGKLFIYRPNVTKEVMYKITYLIYGYTECYFCHRKLRTSELEANNNQYFSKMTLDHLVPQEFGGLTIPNNMRPVCSNCNSTKDNMYLDEFEMYKQFIGKKDEDSKISRKKFREELKTKQEKRRYGQIETIPKEWLTEELIRNIYVNFCITEPLGVEYFRQEKFYKKYKRLPKPIVISENRFLLDGFATILMAKYNHIERVNVVVLENVYYMGFPQ